MAFSILVAAAKGKVDDEEENGEGGQREPVCVVWIKYVSHGSLRVAFE